MDILKQLKGKTTVILTTHYLDEVEALADHIAIIDQGRLKRWHVGGMKQRRKLDQLEYTSWR
jgi:ABC-type multidrug transport system ATPase subunit